MEAVVSTYQEKSVFPSIRAKLFARRKEQLVGTDLPMLAHANLIHRSPRVVGRLGPPGFGLHCYLLLIMVVDAVYHCKETHKKSPYCSGCFDLCNIIKAQLSEQLCS